MANKSGGTFPDPDAAAPADAAASGEAASAPAAEGAAPAEAPKADAAKADDKGAAAPAAGGADGKKVYEANCQACHGGAVPGVPHVGKKEDWAPRIKQGKDTLHKHALEGFNAMPAKGGNGSLSDDEVKAAVDYMANQSGAKFLRFDFESRIGSAFCKRMRFFRAGNLDLAIITEVVIILMIKGRLKDSDGLRIQSRFF